ncbi:MULTISPECIES: hypothetical protein [unclassified Streptomyces]|uniref:hypothetical protein n=1 Tax=unclassified Streptomyces TaxID=2593676 RepID=UPI00036D473F|nr:MULTISPECIES: hypothetical protein [unclassified Streptomyces]MYY03103.1 hypothetical protein [Streptomyces sp. SID4913]
MTEYIAQCRYNRSDTIKARVEDKVVWLEPGVANVALTPADARTFARGILALADGVDGGEAETTMFPAVGDVVRIVCPESACDPEHVGGIGVLTRTDNTDCKYRVRLPGGEIVWAYEVEAPTKPTPNPSPRVAFLEEARRLVGSRDVPQLLAVARFLAGENA